MHRGTHRKKLNVTQHADAKDCAVTAQRRRDIIAAVIDGLGGAERLSEVKRHLVHRFAACAALAEQLEARQIRGEDINTKEYSSLCGSLLRLAQMIGIDQPAPGQKATLTDYLHRHEME
jgi:hypothetical protein